MITVLTICWRGSMQMDSVSFPSPRRESPTRTNTGFMMSTAPRHWIAPAVTGPFPTSTPSQKMCSRPPGFAPTRKFSPLSRTAGLVSRRSAFTLKTGMLITPSPGVLREFRGRGLAQALKWQTVLLAKKEGMRYIRTNNDSQNAPMLAINRKLGYQPEPGLYRLLCALN